MANAQVFTCNYGGSIKNKLLKSGEKLFLKIEDGKISGKAFICNEEGRNGYIDNFDYPINDVREVFKGEYQGNTALIMNTRLTSLYGTKKAQTIFPSMKDIDIVIEKIGQMKESHGGANAAKEPRQATTQSQPIGRPTAPAAPAGAAPTPVAPAPVPKRMETPSQNVVIKQESPVREEGGNVGSAILTRNPQLQQQQAAPVGSSRMNHSPAPAQAPAPAPAPAPAAAPAPAPAPANAPVLKASQPPKKKEKEKDSEDFQKRMEKLYGLKEIGMLTDKEFEDKKLELVSELCGMTDFNEKVQKLVVLKECGMLSDSEFETRKVDIIRECCDTNVSDLNQYKDNISCVTFWNLSDRDSWLGANNYPLLYDSEYQRKPVYYTVRDFKKKK